MGEEIGRSKFTNHDFEQFKKKLAEETKLLRRYFQEDTLNQEGLKIGLELECVLVDQDYRPAPINDELINQLQNPLVNHELSRFNIELNTSPFTVGADCLSRLHNELDKNWNLCVDAAEQIKARVVMIGILPTMEENRLTLSNMSPLERYRALNEQILRLRQGRPVQLDIKGNDHLLSAHGDVMVESAATSLQIHLQIPAKLAARYYNTAQILSAPMTAIAANSPYLFLKDLWDETRIPLFEQAVAIGSFRDKNNRLMGRVTFGSDYASDSLMECFEENLNGYPVLLPSCFDTASEEFKHLRLHNGTIWRWNRPLIGFSSNGPAHVRIEHRVTAAGPSILDSMANVALFLGLAHHYSEQKEAPEESISFVEAHSNFYKAARRGLGADVVWTDGFKGPLVRLFQERLIPEAQKGLERLGLTRDECQTYLSVIAGRIKNHQNGAVWQRAFIKRYGPHFRDLTEAYLAHQKEGNPVHAWETQ